MDAPEGRRGAVSVSRPVLAGAKPSNSSGMKGLISQNNGDKTGQAPVRRQALRHRREHPGHRGSRQPFARPRAKPAGAQGPRPPRNKLPTPHHGAASTSGQGRGKGLSFHRGDPLCAAHLQARAPWGVRRASGDTAPRLLHSSIAVHSRATEVSFCLPRAPGTIQAYPSAQRGWHLPHALTGTPLGAAGASAAL